LIKIFKDPNQSQQPDSSSDIQKLGKIKEETNVKQEPWDDEIKGEPSSSSNHVVLQRIGRKVQEEPAFPGFDEEDIDNVIGSCKFFLKILLHLF